MNKIALWKNVRVNDWTAEKAIIASKDISFSLFFVLKPKSAQFSEH